MPRDDKWVSVNMRRNSVTSPTSPMAGNGVSTDAQNSIPVWLPKDRKTVGNMIKIYFERLNFHRPALMQQSFEQKLAALYDGQTVQHDPGYICCVYLVFALATLSELNHLVSVHEKEGAAGPVNPKLLMPDWPTHEEFFDRALAVKPDLRVSVSSLQALILLHWYLYTEVCLFLSPDC